MSWKIWKFWDWIRRWQFAWKPRRWKLYLVIKTFQSWMILTWATEKIEFDTCSETSVCIPWRQPENKLHGLPSPPKKGPTRRFNWWSRHPPSRSQEDFKFRGLRCSWNDDMEANIRSLRKLAFGHGYGARKPTFCSGLMERMWISKLEIHKFGESKCVKPQAAIRHQTSRNINTVSFKRCHKYPQIASFYMIRNKTFRVAWLQAASLRVQVKKADQAQRWTRCHCNEQRWEQ